MRAIRSGNERLMRLGLRRRIELRTPDQTGGKLKPTLRWRQGLFEGSWLMAPCYAMPSMLGIANTV